MSDRPIDFNDTAAAATSKMKNHIVFILDASSSMRPIRQQVVDYFNQQIDTAREAFAGMATVMSLVEFASKPNEPKFWAVPLETIERLSIEDYYPQGNTALNDAIGQTLDRLELLPDIDDESLSFLVVIITDGDENCSVKYPGRGNANIATRIQGLKKSDRYTIAYMGANQDLSKVQEAMFIPQGNTMSFQNTQSGTLTASLNTSSALRSYAGARSSGVKSVDSFYSTTTGTPPPPGVATLLEDALKKDKK